MNKEAPPVVVYNFDQMDEGMQIEIINEDEDGDWQREQIDVSNDNYQPNKPVADWKTNNTPKNSDPLEGPEGFRKFMKVVKTVGQTILEKIQKVTFPIYINEDIYNHKKNRKEV